MNLVSFLQNLRTSKKMFAEYSPNVPQGPRILFFPYSEGDYKNIPEWVDGGRACRKSLFEKIRVLFIP